MRPAPEPEPGSATVEELEPVESPPVETPVFPAAAPTPILAPVRALTVPPGDPPQAALRLLETLDPALREKTRARVDRLAMELDDLVDQCRETESMDLARFIELSSMKIRTRNLLEARLRSLHAASTLPDRVTVEAETLDLVKSIRKWKSTELLKTERGRLVDKLRSELAGAENDLAATAGMVGNDRMAVPTSVGSGHHRASMLVEKEDELLRRLEAAIARCAGVKTRLAALDGDGDVGRAQSLQQALEQAGGALRVAESFRGRMAGMQGDVARAEFVIREMHDRLARIDPDARRAKIMAEAVETKEHQLTALRAQSEQRQREQAEMMVGRALAGGLQALKELEGMVVPSLASAVNSIRGGDPALTAVVSELIREAESKGAGAF
jgi:hypothetical protein